jgi:hypothetical protein
VLLFGNWSQKPPKSTNEERAKNKRLLIASGVKTKWSLKEDEQLGNLPTDR